MFVEVRKLKGKRKISWYEQTLLCGNTPIVDNFRREILIRVNDELFFMIIGQMRYVLKSDYLIETISS